MGSSKIPFTQIISLTKEVTMSVVSFTKHAEIVQYYLKSASVYLFLTIVCDSVPFEKKNYSLCTRIGRISKIPSNLNSLFTQTSSLTKKLTMSVISVHLHFPPNIELQTTISVAKHAFDVFIWNAKSKHTKTGWKKQAALLWTKPT